MTELVKRAKTIVKADFWYALQVRSGEEFELEEELNGLLPKGEAYCPRRTVVKKLSRHSKKIEPVDEPLYRKFLFVTFRMQFGTPWGMVTRLRNVEGFIRVGEGPLPILPQVISQIKNECALGVYDDNEDPMKIKAGDRVKVASTVDTRKSSPWFGFTGEFQRLAGKHSAIVELALFGRGTLVEIPTELLEKLF